MSRVRNGRDAKLVRQKAAYKRLEKSSTFYEGFKSPDEVAMKNAEVQSKRIEKEMTILEAAGANRA